MARLTMTGWKQIGNLRFVRKESFYNNQFIAFPIKEVELVLHWYITSKGVHLCMYPPIW